MVHRGKKIDLCITENSIRHINCLFMSCLALCIVLAHLQKILVYFKVR